MFDQLRNTLLREIEHRIHLLAAEGVPFGSTLHFDKGAAFVHHYVHIGLGIGIFGVVEIEHRGAIEYPHRYRGEMAMQRVLLDQFLCPEMGHCIGQRHIGTGDRCGTGAAIGLDHVAVEGNRAFTQRRQIDHCAQGAANQALDLHGASTLFTLRRLAPHAHTGGARQHAVFGGHPALPLALEKARHPLLYRGIAQHFGIAEFHQHRTFSMLGVVAGNTDLTQFVGLSATGAHGYLPG